MGVGSEFWKFRRDMPEFSSSVILGCAVVTLRSFLVQPGNLPRISDPDLQLEILSAPPVVQTGDRIEFRSMAFGFRQRAAHIYQSVSEFEIVEHQIEGPLRVWQHRQILTRMDEDRTRLMDEVTFEPPGGMLGFMLTEARIRESLEKSMLLRYQILHDLITAGGLC